MKTATRRPAAGASSSGEIPVSTSLSRRWRGLADRLGGIAYPIVTVVAVAIVLAGQLAEDMADSPPLQMMPPDPLIQRWSVVVLVVYALLMWALLARTVSRALPQVRHLVQIDDRSFASYVQGMRLPSATVDGAIFVGALVINLILFVGLNSDLLLDDPVTERSTKLPSDPVAATVILAGYTVIGWAFLRLIYVGARLARQLGKLSREPLVINVFDTTELLPFGNIALVLALAPAGAILILLVGLGAPTNLVGWSVVAEATLVIILALLLPLRGIHRQMSVAKDNALATINTHISELFETMSGPVPADPIEIARLAGATGTYIPMRKTVQEMTTWPFRDTVAFGRAILIASAPLIYTTLSELIRVFVIGPLTP